MTSHEYPPNSFDPVVLKAFRRSTMLPSFTSPPKPSIAWCGWKRHAMLRWG
jgi:hypothetical protein